jgi:hypothetical protein
MHNRCQRIIAANDHAKVAEADLSQAFTPIVCSLKLRAATLPQG